MIINQNLVPYLIIFFPKKVIMKTPLFLGCLCWAFCSYGQSLDQYVIGSVGNFSSNSTNSTLSWTLGEVVINTASSSSAILTQGFQQPIIIVPTGTNTLIDNSLSINVFPNPTLEQITVQKESNELLKASLINVLGQTIETYDLLDNTTQINLDQLPAANYLLHVQTLDKRTIQTFKIQKVQ